MCIPDPGCLVGTSRNNFVPIRTKDRAKKTICVSAHFNHRETGFQVPDTGSIVAAARNDSLPVGTKSCAHNPARVSPEDGRYLLLLRIPNPRRTVESWRNHLPSIRAKSEAIDQIVV